MWCLFVFISLTQCYPLIDFQYTTPQCNFTTGNALNSFGDLTINTGLFGEALTIALALNDTSVACRLCTMGSAWCQLPIHPYLSDDTQSSYNLRLFTVTQSGLIIPSSYLLPRTATQFVLPAQSLFPFNGPQQNSVCGQHYRLIIQLTLMSAVPRRTYITMAQGTGSVACDPNTGSAGLSCRVAPQYSYIDLNFRNCVSDDTTQSHANDWKQSATIHSPLYWEARRDLWPSGMPLLCGQTLTSLWDYTAPQNYLCDGTYALYIKPRPWYDSMLEATTAYLNQQGYVDGDLLITLNVLEYYCAVRDQDLELTLEDSVLWNQTRLLQARHMPPNVAEECLEVSIQDVNMTLPYFVSHYYDWQLQLFQYMFALDEHLNRNVAFWLIAVSVIGAMCLFVTLYGAIQLCRRWHHIITQNHEKVT
jgi:hypothetical protein